MTPPAEAVILMAGEGSRLRGANKAFLKPFVPVLGRPLISYTLDTLIHANIKTLNFVVGYESERMIAKLKQMIPSNLSVASLKIAIGKNKTAFRCSQRPIALPDRFFSQ